MGLENQFCYLDQLLIISKTEKEITCFIEEVLKIYVAVG